MQNKKILTMAQFGILLAIEAIFCFTVLGSIPIGPLVATLMMIPVVVAAAALGTGAGTLMGFFAGLFSFIVWTFMPPPSSAALAFTFSPFQSFGEFHGNFGSLLICFAPRILTGTIAGLICKSFKDKGVLAYSLAGAVGSVINTIGVLGGTWLFFGSQVESIAGSAILGLIGSIVLTNGIPEAIVTAIAASAICMPVNRMMKKL